MKLKNKPNKLYYIWQNIVYLDMLYKRQSGLYTLKKNEFNAA